MKHYLELKNFRIKYKNEKKNDLNYENCVKKDRNIEKQKKFKMLKREYTQIK